MSAHNDTTETAPATGVDLRRSRPHISSTLRRLLSGRRGVPRVAVAWGVALFLILTGATASQAYWTAASSTLTPAGAGGVVDATLARSDPNPVILPTSTLSGNMPFTYTNTGTLDSNWRFSFTTSGWTANFATFTTWPLNAGETCDAAATPHDATTANGTAPAALTGSATSGSSVIICVRATMSAPNQQSRLGQTIAINATLSASVSNWKGGQSASANMTLTDDQAPSAPTVTLDRLSGYSARLTWPASTDNTSVSGYRIYRDAATTPVATLNASTLTYTDTSLAPNTAYTFRVEAYDAAGNTASGSASATTLNLVTGTKYEFYASYANLCMDIFGGNPNLGGLAVTWDCSGAANQTFTLRAGTDGSYILEPQHSSNTALGVPDSSAGAQLRLRNKTDTGVYWFLETSRDGFALKNATTGLYIDVAAAATDRGTKVTQWSATGGTNQAWVLRPRP